MADPGAPPIRPLWLTATMVAVGVVGAPPAILGIALAFDAASITGRPGIGLAYFGFLALAAGVSLIRAVRALGVGMVLGAVSLALMFLAIGGTSGS